MNLKPQALHHGLITAVNEVIKATDTYLLGHLNAALLQCLNQRQRRLVAVADKDLRELEAWVLG